MKPANTITDGVSLNKAELREKILEQLCAMTSADRLEKSQEISKLLKNFFKTKGFPVAGFSSLPSEPDLQSLYQDLIKEDKSLAFPRVQGEAEMDFYSVQNLEDDMCENTFHIREPVLSQKQLSQKELKLILVPGVAFSENGDRLGRGKAYYDRYLAQSDAFKLGVAFEMQVLKDLPVEPTDIPMDALVTEKGLRKIERNIQ